MTSDEGRPPEKRKEHSLESGLMTEAFPHQKTHSIAMLGFSVNTAGTTVWHQSKIQWRNDPSIIFFFISFLSSRKVLKT